MNKADQISGVAGLRHIEPACARCGCTEDHPCATDAGPCAWVLPPSDVDGLCSACATIEELELFRTAANATRAWRRPEPRFRKVYR